MKDEMILDEHFDSKQMGISVVLIFHCIILSSSFCMCHENVCPIKSTFKENWYFNTVPNVTCVKQHSNCFVYEKMSSPKGPFSMILESVLITFNNEGLWVQLRLKNQEESPHPETVYTAFVMFNRDSFCFKFTIPAFYKKYIFLPNILVHQSLNETLKALTSVYKTSSSRKSQLVLLQANEYSLRDFPEKNMIKVTHLSKSLSMGEFSLKLAFASPCAFALKASVHETSLEICSTHKTPLCKEALILENMHIWKQISLKCPRTFFKAKQIYCIQTVFSPVGACSSTYPEMSSEISYFESEVSDCNRWNMSVKIFHFPNKIKVEFSPFNKYLYCFSCFRVLLYRVGKHGCSSSYRVRILSKTVTLDNNYEGKVTFQNLSRGDYCPEIEPCVKPVLRRYASVFSVLDESSSELLQQQHDNVDILLASIILLSVAAIAAMLQLRRKKKKEVEVIFDEDSGSAAVTASSLVSVLEPRESGLLELLRLCFEDVSSHLHSFVEDGPLGWGKELATYQCPAMGDPSDSGHRFVFVQDGSNPDLSTIRGRAFCTALDIVLSTQQKRFRRDFCHLFVVQLGPPTVLGLQQLVPTKRYTAPEGLVDLCLDLGFPSHQKLQLKRLVEEHALLLRHIE